MMLTSCQNTPECSYHKEKISLEVYPEEWKFDSAESQFYCHYTVPAITSKVYNDGEWSVYREFNHGKWYAYQVVLPMSIYKTDTVREEVIDYYTQYIDYRIGVGYVDIQLTNSDRLYSEEKPESMLFRLQANEEIINLTVNQEDWNFDDNLRQYYCHILVSEITSEIYNYGVFTVCREFNPGTSKAYQVPLPMSLFLADIIPANTPVYYTQYIDYRVGSGYLEVQVTNSDYIYDVKDGKVIPPDTMYIRAVVTY